MGRDALEKRAYQDDAVAKGVVCLKERGYFLLVMTMRAGKTYCVLRMAQAMSLKRVLVICPPNVKAVWEEHVRALPEPKLPYVEVVSQGMLSYKTSKTPNDLVIIDEVHGYRENSKRSQSMATIARHAKYRIGLTGTVCNRSVIELYRPLKIMQDRDDKTQPLYNTGAETRWRNRWALCENPRSDYPRFILHPLCEKAFYQELKQIAYIKDPGHVQRPELVKVPYELTDYQRKACKALEKRVPFELRSYFGLTDPIVCLDKELGPAHIISKQCQVCSGFLYMGDKVGHFPTSKYYKLLELVETLPGTVLIWYNYTEERTILQCVLSSVGRVVTFRTGTPLKTLLDQSPRFILCHPKSAGAGLDLSFASASIYLGISDDFINLKQSEYRISDQLGTLKKNYFMTARNSVEEDRFHTLAAKEKEYLKIYQLGGDDETTHSDQGRQG